MASSVDDDAARRMVSEPGGESYALSGKIMLSGIVILFAVVVFLAVLHLYARWHLVRLRRLQIQRRDNPSHLVLYGDTALPGASTDRGLDVAVLNSLPVSLYTPTAEQPECAVCLSEFEEKEIVRLLPKCNHSFHIECIDMWFRSHSTCPLCRSPIEKAEPTEEMSLSGPGSSSVSSLCDACQHGDGGVASTKGEVRIEVPPRRAESGLELSLSSPASRLMYFKRILAWGGDRPRWRPRAAVGARQRRVGRVRGVGPASWIWRVGPVCRVWNPVGCRRRVEAVSKEATPYFPGN